MATHSCSKARYECVKADLRRERRGPSRLQHASCRPTSLLPPGWPGDDEPSMLAATLPSLVTHPPRKHPCRDLTIRV